MTSTDVTPAVSTDLAIATEQTTWSPTQLAALAHMGVENAPPGDLAVFFHVSKRSGLDPFARQIYMICRRVKNPRTNQFEDKWTIQTGIDGYRLIGHRAASMHEQAVAVGAPEWLREDGQWMPAWASSRWGAPIAARITVTRGGDEFVGVANYDEYVQTYKSKDGQRLPTPMWASMPANQLAKCAEAQAWRKAYPADLAGIYVDAEMDQAAGTPAAVAGRRRPKVTAATFTTAPDAADAVEGEVMSEEPLTAEKRAELASAFTVAGIDHAGQWAYIPDVIGREPSRDEPLTADEAEQVLARLRDQFGGDQ